MLMELVDGGTLVNVLRCAVGQAGRACRSWLACDAPLLWELVNGGQLCAGRACSRVQHWQCFCTTHAEHCLPKNVPCRSHAAQGQRIPEEAVWTYLLQATSGLQHLHR